MTISSTYDEGRRPRTTAEITDDARRAALKAIAALIDSLRARITDLEAENAELRASRDRARNVVAGMVEVPGQASFSEVHAHDAFAIPLEQMIE